ncbi:MAG: 2Fe-2S iron-sulfur cluster binding domain-containing protein [Gammaproteobacteria bacterium]|nr:2Fe-2S iron-sulfur cluster binding domain-containing protein [Gammaproteobacteria bacterium]
MPKVTLDNQTYDCGTNQTILETLLTHQVDVPYGCRQGICHSCMMQSTEGTPPEEAQFGLNDAELAQQCFLACQCYPEEDMQIRLPGDAQSVAATLVSKQILTDEIVQLVFEPDERIEFRAGQFVNLQRKDGLVRSYSIANVPANDCSMEFHIRKLNKGQFSEWAYDTLTQGETIDIHPPQGECFYIPGNQQQQLLLIGTGTGLAPLAGIIADALANQHTGPIHLFHGSREASGLYLVEKFQQLAQAHGNFSYTPCVSQSPAPDAYSLGRANTLALQMYPDLTGTKVYLCGHPEMVKTTQHQAFLAGAKVNDIYADAFLVGDNQG